MRDRVCHCGHRRGDPAIQEEPEYSLWGWIQLVIFGLTPKPEHIQFRCIYCHSALGSSRDPKLLARRTIREST